MLANPTFLFMHPPTPLHCGSYDVHVTASKLHVVNMHALTDVLWVQHFEQLSQDSKPYYTISCAYIFALKLNLKFMWSG